ncbi:hypothetical protein [Streptomyces sp. NPDC014733]|uniref:hypothetical protein n=1 Tax=Streptomyces sp. NPDC014733 TaxID=3364885 RepID=UPI003700CC46
MSVPLLPPELADGQPKPRRGDPLGRRAGRALRKVFASSPATEAAAVTEAARAIQQPVVTGRQIAVSSIRGGAGKSTVAALLALTYAHYRPDPVLAVEADPALGTLPHRLGAREVRWSGSDLAEIVDPSMLITDLTGYLLPFAGGGWLLPGSQGAIGTRLDLDAYRIVMTSLRHHFAATVVDCETLPAEVARTALVTTQARVLVTPATPEGVAATRSVLDWVGGLHPGLLPTTVVVLTHLAPDSGVDARTAAAHLGAGGAAVLPLPYDRHLAAGGAIRTELLGERTLAAAARIAAEVMDRAVSREPGRRPSDPTARGGAPYVAHGVVRPAAAPAAHPRPAPDAAPTVVTGVAGAGAPGAAGAGAPGAGPAGPAPGPVTVTPAGPGAAGPIAPGAGPLPAAGVPPVAKVPPAAGPQSHTPPGPQPPLHPQPQPQPQPHTPLGPRSPQQPQGQHPHQSQPSHQGQPLHQSQHPHQPHQQPLPSQQPLPAHSPASPLASPQTPVPPHTNPYMQPHPPYGTPQQPPAQQPQVNPYVQPPHQPQAAPSPLPPPEPLRATRQPQASPPDGERSPFDAPPDARSPFDGGPLPRPDGAGA